MQQPNVRAWGGGGGEGRCRRGKTLQLHVQRNDKRKAGLATRRGKGVVAHLRLLSGIGRGVAGAGAGAPWGCQRRDMHVKLRKAKL